MHYIENRTFDELKIGDHAEVTRRLSPRDIEHFALSAGDADAADPGPDGDDGDDFHRVLAHGMYGGALIPGVLGAEMPGPGTVFVRQSLSYHRPVGMGDTVTVRVTVRDKAAQTRHVTFDCLCLDADGERVIEGEAEVVAPAEKVRRPRMALPEQHVHPSGMRYRRLIEMTRDLAALRTAVVHPCDENSLAGAIAARDEDLIEPILVGPEARIRATAKDLKLDISGLEIVDAPHSHAAAIEAVGLVRAGKAEALMKGALHTDEVMAAVVDHEGGLRTERRMSHVFALDVPTYPKPLLVTDAALNIYPDLETKRDIVQNAIELAQALGIHQPKVAVLSAVETISPKITSTVEAAALCKMADRGQIRGGIVDGPLAFDNAISRRAARDKGIHSPVAGDADILVAPDLEAGNMIAKQLMYLAGAESAGIVLGARVPIILTSRADKTLSRLGSSAIALLLARGAGGAAPK